MPARTSRTPPQRPDRRQQHGGGAPGRRGGRQPLFLLHLGGGLRLHHILAVVVEADPGRGPSAVSHDLYAEACSRAVGASGDWLRVLEDDTVAWA
ncbi:hypothetical protein ACPA9J_22030 [Pseudomonas aeruginosa]